MRSKKKQQDLEITPAYRAIKKGNPGAAGQAAVAAAALQQLNRYAADIQRFLEESRMKSILDQLQAEVNRPLPGVRSPLRIRRD